MRTGMTDSADSAFRGQAAEGSAGGDGPRLDIVDQGAGEAARPWLGVWYKCANKYVKVFRSPDGQTYTARCPKCGEATRFRVGEGGVSTRFFEIQC